MRAEIEGFDLFTFPSGDRTGYCALVYYSYNGRKMEIAEEDYDIEKALERTGNNTTLLLCDETFAQRLNR